MKTGGVMEGAYSIRVAADTKQGVLQRVGNMAVLILLRLVVELLFADRLFPIVIPTNHRLAQDIAGRADH